MMGVHTKDMIDMVKTLKEGGLKIRNDRKKQRLHYDAILDTQQVVGGSQSGS